MRIRLFTLGRVGCDLDGEELADFPSQRVRYAMLTFLALERKASRETVQNLFWSDRAEDKGRGTLKQTIYELRRMLGEECIESRGEELHVYPRLSTDFQHFEEAVEAKAWETALEHYSGEFLRGFSLPNCKPFEFWIDRQRAHAARLHRTARRARIAELLAAHDVRTAASVARRWVELEPLDDEAQHKLIELLAATGERTEALQQAENYERLLRAEELEPLEETKRLIARIQQREPVALTASASGPQATPTQEHIPSWLNAAVMKALAKEPSARFADAEEFDRALRWSIKTQTRGDSQRGGNLGRFVSRTCDRWRQVNAFEAGFRAACRGHPGRPQFYVVHGEEGQAHDSFVARLIATRITHFAAELGGEERGMVLSFRSPWPKDDVLEVRCRDLTISLFREMAPAYMGHDMSATALVGLSAASLSPITVIQHELRARNWDAATDDLVRWYVNSFWGALQPTNSAQLFLIVLKVIYPPASLRNRFLRKLLRAWTNKQSVLNRLPRLFVDATCPCSVLPELGYVTPDNVKSWFGQNGIYDSERRRLELIEVIFKATGEMRMSEVEPALDEIHRDFVREASARHWSEAW